MFSFCKRTSSDPTAEFGHHMLNKRVKLVYVPGGPKIDIQVTPYMQLCKLHPDTAYKWDEAISGTCSFTWNANNRFYTNGIGCISHIGILDNIVLIQDGTMAWVLDVIVDSVHYIFRSDESFSEHYDDITIPHTYPLEVDPLEIEKWLYFTK